VVTQESGFWLETIMALAKADSLAVDRDNDRSRVAIAPQKPARPAQF